jgi:hypothetical protein
MSVAWASVREWPPTRILKGRARLADNLNMRACLRAVLASLIATGAAAHASPAATKAPSLTASNAVRAARVFVGRQGLSVREPTFCDRKTAARFVCSVAVSRTKCETLDVWRAASGRIIVREARSGYCLNAAR